MIPAKDFAEHILGLCSAGNMSDLLLPELTVLVQRIQQDALDKNGAMTKCSVQRLEAWMKEITDVLCYQPDIPMDHKTCIVNALKLFQNEI
jgi:hypothetical protein